MMSPDLSRRPSLSTQKEDAGEAETKRARDAMLQLEQEKASIQAGVLKQSLGHLGTFSTNTTKHLDDTYYAVLEKMSTLQNTVTAMKGLAEGLRDMCDGFDDDSRALESDTVSQLVALGRFEEQEAKISSLQNRVHHGRARIQGLTGRVDVVRERIEGWERADRDWQERTRKRLKIFWSVTSVVAILIVALAVGVKYTTKLDDARPRSLGAGSTIRPWLNALNHSSEDGDGEPGKTMLWKTPEADDERLRVFDEL
ncbi:hypothetical protein HRG_005694 [Hirsutella rhossiliensis]|uniref:Uncharacterized protein n=1 Tax=Hirsutella rhossiliensis TaxID=111463 RepID=A0A9P8SIH4_9HYPO|nr:uncharacterized protein HRG_05694 [Hirsutella rhossiliensis]KAH0963184.1 hypothetical protein HRG_05694 [Hirsutella rhossiliensis]